jgi:hypothetical protein
VKKIFILKNNGGRLANQLWNFASVFSYCLEKNYECVNDRFLNYHNYYNFKPSNWFTSLLSKLPNKKTSLRIYNLYVKLVELINKKNILSDQDKDYYLPPETNIDPAISKNKLYLSGWLFRNPAGLKKYHPQTQKAFRPKEEYCKPGEELVQNLKQKYKHIIGVHIRQGDYKTWQDGKFYFTSKEVANILKDYLKHTNKKNETIFIICSDGKIDEKEFENINFVKGPGTEITDLHTLSLTDYIIGSNSTYNLWAAYFGSVPRKEFSHDKINWEI